MIIKEVCTVGSTIGYQKIDCSEQAFLLRRIPILQSVHERLIQGLQQVLSTLIKIPCLITQKNLQSRFIDGYFKQMPASVSMNTFCVGPMNAQVLLLLDEALIYHMVDRAFGGTGKAPSKTSRCLTSTELAWMHALLSAVSKQLQSAFESTVQLHCTLEESQINPVSAQQAYPPKMLVAVCPLELLVESQVIGQLTFFWPHEWLIDIQDIKNNHADHHRKKETPKNFKNNLYKALEDVKVDIKAVRGNKKITLSEISNWKVGDLISMDFQKNSTLLVESTPLFSVELGNADDKYAVKIVDKI
jgi:flagellar motor switch protein FliM